MVVISCPLCCTQTFSSHSALRIHLLSILETIFCPSCNKKFNTLLELAKHLETDDCISTFFVNDDSKSETYVCKTESSELEEENRSEPDTETTVLVKTISSSEEISNNQYVEENEYYCQMCQVDFNDLESHLKEFHDGEEVILENENQGEEQQENSIFFVDTTEVNEEPISDLTEEVLDRDKEGRFYSRKFVKIGKFWLQQEAGPKDPLISKNIVKNGEVKKITDTESEQIDDKSAIIEITQCPDCSTLFHNFDLYKQHKCPNREEKHKCKVCNLIFNSAEEVILHLNTTHVTKASKNEIGPFECTICKTKFPTFKSLRLHKRMHEPVKKREIEAPVNYGIEESADNYETSTSNREMFICTICNKTYDKQYETIHLKSHSSKDNGYNCDVCNRKFFSESHLTMHMKAHTNNKKFACSYCKKPFVTYDALTQHVESGCQKRSYSCQFCGRRFSRPHEKVKHERIHTGEKPHVCDICGKAFRVSYCLTLHLRTHSGTRPYLCRECGKRFKSHSVYNHHMHTHSDVRNYKCPFCPKAFKTSVQLAGHKNSHTKPFSCTECNRPFASLYAVRAHMETHKRENSLRFDCWICGALYSRAFALKDHMKQQHPEMEGKKAKDVVVGVEEDEEMDATSSILVQEDDLLGLDNNTANIEIIENESV